jgi:hypothetical protein
MTVPTGLEPVTFGLGMMLRYLISFGFLLSTCFVDRCPTAFIALCVSATQRSNPVSFQAEIGTNLEQLQAIRR